MMRRLQAVCLAAQPLPVATSRPARRSAHHGEPPPSVTPCNVDGGTYEHFLQLALQQKHAETMEKKRAALQLLLDVGHLPGTTAAVDEEADSAAAREKRMSSALHLVSSMTHTPVFDGYKKYDYLLHLDQPVGHVQVPLTVGFVYLQLQQLGYDAAAWWRGYYRAYVGQQPPAPEDSAVPPLYWMQPMPRDGADNNNNKKALYATPAPSFFQGSRPAASDGAGGTPQAANCCTPPEPPYWIPAALLVHLPFFPIPHPLAAEGSSLDFASFLRDPEAETLEDVAEGLSTVAGQGDPAAYWHTSPHERASQELRRTSDPTSARSPAALWKAGTTSKPLNSTHCRSTRPFGWEHAFYDGLFATWNARRRDRAQIDGKSHTSDARDAAVGVASLCAWEREQRTAFGLEAPWHEMPVLASGPEKELQGSEFGATVKPRTATSRQQWPDAVTMLNIGAWYQPGISSFWSRKSNPMANLPLPYFFPAASFPFLYSRVRLMRGAKQGYRRNSTNHTPWRRVPSSVSSSTQPASSRVHAAHDLVRGPQEWRGADRRCGADQRCTSPSKQWGWTAAEAERDAAISPFATLASNWQLFAVTYFGRRYLPVSRTTLACLFDSTLCEQHALPLSVTGVPLYTSINLIRHRQQRSHASCPTSDVRLAQSTGKTPVPSTRRGVVGEQMADKRCKANGAATPSAAVAPGRTSPWLARLRRIELDRGSSNHSCEAGTSSDRATLQRLQFQRSHFRFRSPYWVEVQDIYERWGVHVAPGVVPLRSPVGSLVNAEQTTDASVFTPATCVPHLAQNILCIDGLAHCTWAVSQRLLGIRVPATRAPRCGLRAVRAWTYETLKARGAAAQGVSNLWVADEMVREMGWTLRAVAVAAAPPARRHTAATTTTIVHAAVPVQGIASRRTRFRLEQEATLTAAPPFTAADDEASFLTAPSAERDATEACQECLRRSAHNLVMVFHSSCVVEEAQLRFVSTFAPHVLLFRIPDVTEEEMREYGEKRTSWLRRVRQSVTERQLDELVAQKSTEMGKAADADDGCTDGKDRASVVSYEDGGYDGGGKNPPSSSQREALRRYLVAMKQKRVHWAKPFSAARIDEASRLQLARVALQRGYKSENAHRWVSVDFLRDEPRVRPPPTAEGSGAAVQLTAVEVTVQCHRAKEGQNSWAKTNGGLPFVTPEDAVGTAEVSTKEEVTMTLVNAEELEWSTADPALDRLRWLWVYL